MKNAGYQATYDVGFDTETIVYANVKNEAGFRTMRNALLERTDIQKIGGSRHSVTASWYNDPIRVGTTEQDVDIMDIGAHYLETINATILAGRNFKENSSYDVEKSVIINEDLAKTFNWDDPIGKRIVLRDTIELLVIGMVKDILIDGALWNPVSPMMLRYVLPEKFRYISVKTDILNARSV